MSPQKIIVICAAVVVIGGGVWFFTHKTADAPETTSIEAVTASDARGTSEAEMESLNGLGSLASVFSLGQNLRCEFSSRGSDGSSEGTFYTDGERFRVTAQHDFSSDVRQSSDMINDGDFMYIWGQSPEGDMAMKMPVLDENDWAEYDSPADSEQEYVDVDEEVEYDCDRWRVDPSVFVPPSDVEFMDMAAMMQEAMSGMSEGFEMPEGIELPPGFEMP